MTVRPTERGIFSRRNVIVAGAMAILSLALGYLTQAAIYS